MVIGCFFFEWKDISVAQGHKAQMYKCPTAVEVAREDAMVGVLHHRQPAPLTAPITCHSPTRHVILNFHISLAPNTHTCLKTLLLPQRYWTIIRLP